MFCPLRGTWKPVCKDLCMHKSGSTGECRFKQDSALIELHEKVRVQSIVDSRSVSKQDVRLAAKRIKLAVVADAFVEYITGRSVLDQKGGELNLDKDAFDAWNKTDFSFEEVSTLITEVQQSLRGKHANTQPS